MAHRHQLNAKNLKDGLEVRDGSRGPMIRRACAFEVKAVGEDGAVEGYGSVFNVADSYEDVVAKGTFLESLKAHKAAGTMPAMLWQHDACEPIGKWDEMVEDSKGLLCKGRLFLDIDKARTVRTLLQGGAISGLSIGFCSVKWSYDEETDLRTLTQVDLWEVSLVTFPANPAARITSVKSADDFASPKDAERLLREAGVFSKSDATAFVSRVLRMGAERGEPVADFKRFNAAANRLQDLLKPTR